MSTKTEIQALLRFLAQDAKVPLPTAIGKVKDLQAAGFPRYSLKKLSIFLMTHCTNRIPT